jgi:hypothetical protein
MGGLCRAKGHEVGESSLYPLPSPSWLSRSSTAIPSGTSCGGIQPCRINSVYRSDLALDTASASPTASLGSPAWFATAFASWSSASTARRISGSSRSSDALSDESTQDSVTGGSRVVVIFDWARLRRAQRARAGRRPGTGASAPARPARAAGPAPRRSAAEPRLTRRKESPHTDGPGLAWSGPRSSGLLILFVVARHLFQHHDEIEP